MDTKKFNVQQLLRNAETEIENLKLQLNSLEAEKLQVLDELARAGQDTKAFELKIQLLTTAGVEMEAKIACIEVQLRECREKTDQKIQELLSTIKSKERELASAIGQLISEMKAGSDVRARLERAAETMRKEMDIEREAVCDRERKMEKQIEVFMFNFLSDSSTDGDQTVDAGEVNRRFEALSRGARISPTPSGSAAPKRRRSASGPGVPAAAAAAAQGGPRLKTNNNDDLTSLSPVEDDDAMKAKERIVFKIKHHENKPKKFKQTF